MVHQKQFTIQTKGHRDMHDLTAAVQRIVASSGIRVGIANVSQIGSTAAIGTIEFEPGLRKDLPEMLDRLIPPSTNYGHELTWHDGNGHSHLQATLLGPALTVAVQDGKLALGTWQKIILLECDIRERERTMVVTVLGEK